MKHLILIIVSFFLFTIVAAQNLNQKAITLASEHPALSLILSSNKGWTAKAYDTRNAYGVWRVQFWNAEGEVIASMDLNPNNAKIYNWNYLKGVNELEKQQAEAAILAYLATNTEITDLLGDIDLYDMRIAYRNHNIWSARINRGVDSVEIFLESANVRMRSMDNLRLIGFNFPGIVSFEEWQSANEANIIATAFGEAEIAAKLRGIENWTTEVSPKTDEIWTVKFLLGENLIATANVDIYNLTTLDYSIE